MHLVVFLIGCFFIAVPVAFAQQGILVNHGGVPLEGVRLQILSVPENDTLYSIKSNSSGQLMFPNALPSTGKIRISHPGFVSITWDSLPKMPQEGWISIQLVREAKTLTPFVVSGSRSPTRQNESSVAVSILPNERLEQVQALSLAEGLAFSPGLRVENNCQNCGFTQVRLNGLDGPYTQILINNRPVYSALAGVYGLDMLPVSLIDRVEVVRGGGSVLYGGNGIAGTINIITQEPIRNRVELHQFVRLVNGEVPDLTTTGFADLVAKDGNGGVRLMLFHRNRDYWDANGDGFSELVRWSNQTASLDAFYKTSQASRLKLKAWFTKEFRRGGNHFQLEPHQTDLTEQLEHRITGADLTWETLFKDPRHRLSLYLSGQRVVRHSYYGGGGRVLEPGDSLTEADLLALNAYGNSEDFSLVGGVQYAGVLAKNLTTTAGSEYQTNTVFDEMPGYQRQIDQTVQVLGAYAQLEWKPLPKLSLVGGARFDYVSIDGTYRFGQSLANFYQQEQLPVFVPRATVRWQFHEALTLRGGFAQGYRAPQAFDEDLHIETVGGAALFTQFDADLTTERSNNGTLGISWIPNWQKRPLSLRSELFYTRLLNPFVLSGQTELPSGLAVITKRNGDGGYSAGCNMEVSWLPRLNLELSIGGTALQARYEKPEELWASPTGNPDSLVQTQRWLRTPDFFGYFSAVWKPINALEWVVSGNWIGSMLVPHVVDPETEFTQLKTSPWFFEAQTRVGYTFVLSKQMQLEIQAGVRNLFNSFQNDFDVGAERDAGYVYGPLSPRTYVVSVRFSLD